MEAFNDLFKIPAMPGLPPPSALASLQDFNTFLQDPNQNAALFEYLSHSIKHLPLLHSRISEIREKLVEFENFQQNEISSFQESSRKEYDASTRNLINEHDASTQALRDQLQRSQDMISSNAASAVVAARTNDRLSTQVAELTNALNARPANPTLSTSALINETLHSTNMSPAPTSIAPTYMGEVHRTAHTPKHPDPDKFTGEREDLDRFLSNISMKLLINADWFSTEQAKVAYIASRLGGIAHLQFHNQFKQPDLGFASHTDLTKALVRAFGDIDPAATAQAKLDQLYQRNTDLVTYLATFNRYASATGYNDVGLIRILFDHASDELRGMQLTSERPNNLVDACNLLLQLDTRLKLNRNTTRIGTQDRSRSHFQPPFLQSHPGSTVSSKSYGSFALGPSPATIIPSDSISSAGGDPMDLSSVRRRVPQAEKDRRRAAGLCPVCASASHTISGCPSFKCFNCHKQGHAWSRCPERQPLRIHQTETVASSSQFTPSGTSTSSENA